MLPVPLVETGTPLPPSRDHPVTLVPEPPFLPHTPANWTVTTVPLA